MTGRFSRNREENGACPYGGSRPTRSPLLKRVLFVGDGFSPYRSPPLVLPLSLLIHSCRQHLFFDLKAPIVVAGRCPVPFSSWKLIFPVPPLLCAAVPATRGGSDRVFFPDPPLRSLGRRLPPLAFGPGHQQSPLVHHVKGQRTAHYIADGLLWPFLFPLK